MTPRFVHLHCHTEYSIIDSLIRVNSFVQAIQAAEMPACAITDVHNLFALVKFYRAAQTAGVKPLIGAEITLQTASQTPNRLILLCQNHQGYLNLSKLLSRSYIEGLTPKGYPSLKLAWLDGYTDGLIALSLGKDGDIGQALLAGHPQQAEQYLTTWKRLFPNRFYLTVQRTGKNNEEEYIHAVIPFATDNQIPLVATNEVCFLKPEDFEAHEIRVCIREGFTLEDPKRVKNYTAQQYLRSPQEMADLFADLPEALETSWDIAQRCNLMLTLGQTSLPDFPIPDNKSTDSYFCEQAQIGLQQRLQTFADANDSDFPQQQQQYESRLQRELEVILQMGFAGYFLIVQEFINWAKQNNTPVGPGRGSGAGSLVAYALGITDLDPLKYDLLFERFLNPERVSMPDFDVDFCIEGRDDVIRHVADLYGHNKVSQIITFGTMAARAVVRDVGRVLGQPYGFVDALAKLIPGTPGMMLKTALEQEEKLQERYGQEEDVAELIDMAMKLEGLTRNVGTHAGGVVISPSDLTDFTPLYWDGDPLNNVVSQFDKNDVETIGLVKFDFLGLRNLTIIKWTLENIQRFEGKTVDILQIPLNDKATFQLLQKAKTTAVFQLESRGMKELIKRLKPDCFEDIIALVALFRPGPLQSGMVDDFINRKHGHAVIEYPHPDLATCLQPTYGVILYQEQVMQIAQILAGYTLGGADLLRRAMGKKKPEEMAKQRSVFTEGAVQRGIDESKATYIFDLMEKFAAYGFNKSHSAAYALVAYQTAWLKTHHPAAFMAAALSSDMDNTDKVVNLIDECQNLNLTLLPPDIHSSEYKFTIDAEQRIIYGLGAIKGVGEAAIETIVSTRIEGGAFKDLFDLCQRIDLRKVTRRTLEPLIKSGALDKLGPSREVMLASLDAAMKYGEKQSTDREYGQNDLFGSLMVEKPQPTVTFVNNVKQWSIVERLQGEQESLGLYLSGHPIEPYKKELQQLKTTPLNALKVGVKTRVAGLIVTLRIIKSKRGKMASVTLDDSTSRLEAVIYSDLYAKVQDLLVKDTVILLQGDVKEDEYNGGYNIIAEEVLSLTQAREKFATSLNMQVTTAQADDEFIQNLRHILQRYNQGSCPVFIHYQQPDKIVTLKLGKEWQVKVSQALLQDLEKLVGTQQVSCLY